MGCDEEEVFWCQQANDEPFEFVYWQLEVATGPAPTTTLRYIEMERGPGGDEESAETADEDGKRATELRLFLPGDGRIHHGMVGWWSDEGATRVLL